MAKAPTVEELGQEDLVTATMHSWGRDPLTGTVLRPGDTVQLPKSVGADFLRRGHLRKATKDEKEAALAEPEDTGINGTAEDESATDESAEPAAEEESAE